MHNFKYSVITSSSGNLPKMFKKPFNAPVEYFINSIEMKRNNAHKLGRKSNHDYMLGFA